MWVSFTGSFTFRPRRPGTHSVGGCIEQRAGLTVWRTGQYLAPAWNQTTIRWWSITWPDWSGKSYDCRKLEVVIRCHLLYCPNFERHEQVCVFGTQITLNNLTACVRLIHTHKASVCTSQGTECASIIKAYWLSFFIVSCMTHIKTLRLHNAGVS
jgi:hypothetical protein